MWQPMFVPPSLTFGHDTLTSTASQRTAARSASTRAAISPNSSGEFPAMLTIIRAGPRSAFTRGALSRTNASQPTLASPIEFSMPALVSATRGAGFPSRGAENRVLVTKPPSVERGQNRSNASP